MFRAVVFDLDNTLFPEQSYRDAAYWNIAVRLGQHFGRGSGEVYSLLSRIVERKGEHRAFWRVLSKYGVRDDSAFKCIEQVIIPAYRTCKCKLELYDDAKTVLRALKKKNDVLTGMVTNGGKDTQWNKIKLLGIQDFFDCIVVAGEHFSRDRWKPNPAPFAMCFERLGVDPADCLYVGDNPELDVPGAVSLGATVLLVSRDGVSTDSSDCVQIDSLTRVLEWLR
ncbi:MAG: HAD family hydrolase [Armatimonadota bacterium]